MKICVEANKGNDLPLPLPTKRYQRLVSDPNYFRRRWLLLRFSNVRSKLDRPSESFQRDSRFYVLCTCQNESRRVADSASKKTRSIFHRRKDI